MIKTTANPSSPVANPSDRLAGVINSLASGLAVASLLFVVLTLLVPAFQSANAGWSETVLILAFMLSTVTSQTRRLPLQNVLLAGCIIALIGGAVHALGVVTAIPFGPFIYTNSAGPRFFDTLPWAIPFVWVIAIMNSRGVARLMLRPWRKLHAYGFWLIGITVALTVLFDLALEPYAAIVKHYWLWHETRLPWTWGGAPVTNFLGWLVTALLILAFTTPALIDKKRQRSSKRSPDYHPLLTWLLAMTLFGVGAATHQLWPAVIYCVVVGVTVTVFAFRGAKW
jgi:uncharacterized membrane protein